jgi:hypothetical protein
MRFYLETAGALPRRGDRCLAAVGGERVQAKYDKRRRRCVPEGLRGWDTVSGEVSGSGTLGWLGERTSTERLPRVRRNAVYQGTVDRGR